MSSWFQHTCSFYALQCWQVWVIKAHSIRLSCGSISAISLACAICSPLLYLVQCSTKSSKRKDHFDMHCMMLILIPNWGDLQQFMIAQWYSFRLPLQSPGFKYRSMLSSFFFFFHLIFPNFFLKTIRKKWKNYFPSWALNSGFFGESQRLCQWATKES